jgi:hypothetical protein
MLFGSDGNRKSSMTWAVSESRATRFHGWLLIADQQTGCLHRKNGALRNHGWKKNRDGKGSSRLFYKGILKNRNRLAIIVSIN